jgi:hypothetical protein
VLDAKELRSQHVRVTGTPIFRKRGKVGWEDFNREQPTMWVARDSSLPICLEFNRPWVLLSMDRITQLDQIIRDCSERTYLRAPQRVVMEPLSKCGAGSNVQCVVTTHWTQFDANSFRTGYRRQTNLPAYPRGLRWRRPRQLARASSRRCLSCR